MFALCLYTLAGPADAGAQTTPTTLPGVGESIAIDEIRLTFLAAERLTGAELRTPDGLLFARGGLRLVWFVENRPGVPIPPALGEVRVFLDSRLYNKVTHAGSRDPFAPEISIHDPASFFSGETGKRFRDRAPTSRSGSVTTLLEVLVRGDMVPFGSTGVAEIEQGSTEGAKLIGDRPTFPRGYPNKYYWFRFRLPPL